jgi:hypothetical protein
MQITKENLQGLYELYQKLEEAKDRASDLLKTAKDRYGHREVQLEREGKKITVKEDILWQEVFYLGNDSQAGRELSKKHPEVFEAFEKQNAAAKDCDKYVMMNFGMRSEQVTIGNIFALTEAMCRFILAEEAGFKIKRENWFDKIIKKS